MDRNFPQFPPQNFLSQLRHHIVGRGINKLGRHTSAFGHQINANDNPLKINSINQITSRALIFLSHPSLRPTSPHDPVIKIFCTTPYFFWSKNSVLEEKIRTLSGNHGFSRVFLPDKVILRQDPLNIKYTPSRVIEKRRVEVRLNQI